MSSTWYGGFTILAAFVCVACGSEGEPVGPEGGVIEFDGGTLEIPAGALDADVTIQVTRSPGPGEPYMVGDHFTFSPSGLTFAEPATLTFTTDEALEDDEEFVIYKWVDRDPFVDGDEMLSVHRADNDAERGEVSTAIDGFSVWGVARACTSSSTSSQCRSRNNSGSRSGRVIVIPWPTVTGPVEFEADWKGCRREFDLFIPGGAASPWGSGFADGDIWVLRAYDTGANGFVHDYTANLTRGEVEIMPGRAKPAPDEPPGRYKFDAYASYGDWFGRQMVSPPASQTVFALEYVNPAAPANAEVSSVSATENALRWREGEHPPSVVNPVVDYYEITRHPAWPSDPTRFVDGDETTLIRDENGDLVQVVELVDPEAAGVSHYYVRAVNTRDCSSPLASNWSVVWAGATPSVPDAPPNLEANESPGRVSLSWGNVLGASFYRVYVGTDAAGYKLLAEVPREFTSFTDAFASAGMVSYRVTAVNEIGESDFADVDVNVSEPGPGPGGNPGDLVTLSLRGSDLSVYVDPAPEGAPDGFSAVYCIPTGDVESDAGVECFRDGQDVPHPLVYAAGTTVSVEPTSSDEPLWRASRDCERPGASPTATVTLDGDRVCSIREPIESGQLRLSYAVGTCADPLTVEVYEGPTGILVDECVASAGGRCEFSLADDTPLPLSLRLVAPNAGAIGVANGPTDDPGAGISIVDCPAADITGNEATIDMVESIPPGGFLRDYMISCELTLDCP